MIGVSVIGCRALISRSRKVVVDAAKYYRISRNFKKSRDSGDHLAEIVRVLDSIRPSSVRSDYVSQVEEFTSQLNTIYGKEICQPHPNCFGSSANARLLCLIRALWKL
jgi:hypothetical protein